MRNQPPCIPIRRSPSLSASALSLRARSSRSSSRRSHRRRSSSRRSRRPIRRNYAQPPQYPPHFAPQQAAYPYPRAAAAAGLPRLAAAARGFRCLTAARSRSQRPIAPYPMSAPQAPAAAIRRLPSLPMRRAEPYPAAASREMSPIEEVRESLREFRDAIRDLTESRAPPLLFERRNSLRRVSSLRHRTAQ